MTPAVPANSAEDPKSTGLTTQKTVQFISQVETSKCVIYIFMLLSFDTNKWNSFYDDVYGPLQFLAFFFSFKSVPYKLEGPGNSSGNRSTSFGQTIQTLWTKEENPR